VIVGGTRVADDWFVLLFCDPAEIVPYLVRRYPTIRPETTLDILKRGLSLCPELAAPEIRAEREPKLEDVLPIVIEEGCGLRPARKGGIRLEVQWSEVARLGGQAKVPVVFNYG
jgi:hypothetical protein